MSESGIGEILWKSKCNASVLPAVLGFIPLVAFISIFFVMHFLGFGAVAITLIVVAAVGITLMLVYGRTHRFHNRALIFCLTDQGVIFTSKNNNSYFFNEYENIADYSYVKHNERYATVILNFKHPENAGAFGNLTSLPMVKIEYVELLKKLLEAKDIPCVQNPSVRDKFNRSK